MVSRLERLSADSIWAHRVSGYRGALLRSIAKVKEIDNSADSKGWDKNSELVYLENLLAQGYVLLEKAARELIS